MSQKSSYQRKIQIKEALRQLAFPEAIMLSPSPRKVLTKGAKKKVKSIPNKASTSQISSLWERVDSQFSDT